MLSYRCKRSRAIYVGMGVIGFCGFGTVSIILALSRNPPGENYPGGSLFAALISLALTPLIIRGFQIGKGVECKPDEVVYRSMLRTYRIPQSEILDFMTGLRFRSPSPLKFQQIGLKLSSGEFWLPETSIPSPKSLVKNPKEIDRQNQFVLEARKWLHRSEGGPCAKDSATFPPDATQGCES